MDAWTGIPIDQPLLDKIRAAWESEVGADEFEVEMGLIFNGFSDDLAHPERGSSYRVMTVNGTYHAIMEIVDTRRGTMTKMLSLYLSPKYWDTPSPNELAKVYVEAVVEIIVLAGEKSANGSFPGHDVKIYGRNQALLDVLHTIQNNWSTLETGSTQAAMEGRWLKITFL